LWKKTFAYNSKVNFVLLPIGGEGVFVPELDFEGVATWKSGMECNISVKGKNLATVSPPPSFGGTAGYCSPEDIFAAALASCINTLYLLIAKNSQLTLKSLETKATVKMHVEGMEKLIFTNVHFNMMVGLEKDNEHERSKAEKIYAMAQKICPIRQSWGEGVPISFDLKFV
jgi:organic hydroperoxide reductase OsmC/OhrA